MTDICCIGHITLDKVVTPSSVVHMPGGTSFYFSNAIRRMEVSYQLVTALGPSERYIARELSDKGIDVKLLDSTHTVYFENIYGESSDHRTQRVLQKADPFTAPQLSDIHAKIFHLGPLLADDMDTGLIRSLAERGTVSLDVQGFLRKVEDQKVYPVDWAEKQLALPHVTILKANNEETEVLTGTADRYEGARILALMGVKEVIVTLGSKGSLIYTGGTFYEIPAYTPKTLTDATGCGDTYMAGYLYRRIQGDTIEDAGKFAAAMATLNIGSSGPFTGTHNDVIEVLSTG